MTASDAYVVGTGSALPGPPVDNAELARHFPVNAEWIERFIGTRTRHFAVDLATGEQRTGLAELAATAAGQALAKAGVEPDEVSFVVLGTASPDSLMPATVNLAADILGIDRVPTFQLQSGCAGAVQALETAMALLSPDRPLGLVIGGDVCAKHMDLRRGLGKLPPSELVNYAIFGDGAGAAVLSAQPAPGALAVRHVLNRFTGLGRPPGQVINWYGAAGRADGEQPVVEDYKAIEARVPVMAGEILWELLDRTGWDAGTISYLLPPQLSGVMTPRIVKELGLPGTVEVSVVAEVGNNGNALPFLQLDRLAEMVRPGERAVAVAVESSKWLKAGFTLEGV
ncbi:3-oxoacyl-ACP synthase III family protein [Microbispora sp. NPDC049125]|uniref:3-oxoacyl-ACP synthase III family protein n=1 Tax=Microbispora sp. NPDC049125 TaxID=3154929 RepID=UPI003466CB56